VRVMVAVAEVMEVVGREVEAKEALVGVLVALKVVATAVGVVVVARGAAMAVVAMEVAALVAAGLAVGEAVVKEEEDTREARSSWANVGVVGWAMAAGEMAMVAVEKAAAATVMAAAAMAVVEAEMEEG
jgi:hypothetical protein